MPDDTQGQGTTLWNLQTQSPEWVQLSDVQAKIDSGQYRTYASSGVTLEQGAGGEGEYDPTAAQHVLQGGASRTYTEAKRGAAGAHEDALARHSGIGDKLLTVASSGAEAISGGLLKGLPGEDPEERDLRREANPGSATLGSVAALATAVFAPESLIKYTPLGLAGEAGAGVAGALKGAAGGVLRGAGAEAVGGAAAGAILGSTNQIGNALTGRKVSGDAIVDDIGLGLLVGGGIGAVGGLAAKAAGKIRNARSEIKAAAEFDESAKPVATAIGDASEAWHTAHEGAQVRLKILNKIAEDSGVPEEWLAARNDAAGLADKAAKRLHKIAGTDDPAGVGRRIADLATSGKAKEAENLFHAFNEYGTAVSRLDDAMRPVTTDLAFTGGLQDLEGTMAAADHPYQQIEAMINNGASADEILAFQKRANEANGFEDVTPPEGVEPMDAERAARAEQATGGGKVRKVAPEPLVKGRSKPKDFDVSDSKGLPTSEEGGRFDVSDVTKPYRGRKGDKMVEADFEAGVDRESYAKGRRRDLKDLRDAEPQAEPGFDGRAPTKQTPIELAEQPTPRRSPAYEPEPEVPGARGRRYDAEGQGPGYERPGEYPLEGKKTGGNGEPGRRADQILYNAGRDARPVMPSELGDQIKSALDNLQSATGGRLGSAEARALAKKLGMNTEKLSGPVASRLVDLWGLHRMAEAVAEGAGSKATALDGVLRAMGASAGYKMGGFVGARVVGGMVGTATKGMRSLVSTMGRLKQDAVLGMAKVLSPAGRKAVTLGAIGRTVSTSYQPGTQPTTDYKTKADQLRNAVAAPDAIKGKIQEDLKDVGALDPSAAVAATESAYRRIQGLAKALPQGTYWGPFDPPGPPKNEDLDSWHEYEAITHDRNLIFDYLKTGHVTASVREAMQEQHPDFMQELSTYVATHQEEIQAAPPRVKQALSQLLGMPLSYEADPEYIQRLQVSYQEAKQKAAQKMGAMQQSQAIKAGISPGSASPLPGQMMAALSPLQQR